MGTFQGSTMAAPVDGTDRALDGAPGFVTPDPREAKARTERMLGCAHRMVVLDRAAPFRAGVKYLEVDGFGLMSSTYGAPVEICCTPPIPWVTVSFVAGGAVVFSQGDDAAVVDRSRAGVLAYDREVAMRWSPGVGQLMLTIDKARVETFLRRLLHEPVSEPLRFETRLDVGGEGRGLAGAVATMRRAFTGCGPEGPRPALAAEIEHSVVSALLLGQRHNYTDAIFSATALPSSRVVDRVVELVESSTDAAFTVADLAAYAGISERSLHAAFRRQLGVAPMAYVRRRRLDRAHDELLTLEPNGTATVTEVALRHGFTHGGRFAAAYRARFGEPPSQTLRR